MMPRQRISTMHYQYPYQNDHCVDHEKRVFDQDLYDEAFLRAFACLVDLQSVFDADLLLALVLVGKGIECVRLVSCTISFHSSLAVQLRQQHPSLEAHFWSRLKWKN